AQVRQPRLEHVPGDMAGQLAGIGEAFDHKEVGAGGDGDERNSERQAARRLRGVLACRPQGARSRSERGRRHRVHPLGVAGIGEAFVALLPLFRLVGALCIAALWGVESLLRHRRERPKLTDRSFDLEIHRRCLPRLSSISYSMCCPSLSVLSPARSTADMWTNTCG